MKEYIKGKARLRITDSWDDYVKMEYFHNGKCLTYFRPKNEYKNLVGFIRINWLKEKESVVLDWLRRGKA